MPEGVPVRKAAASEVHPTENTSRLLELIRDGDDSARDRLISRYWTALRRWAHGRTPAGIRDLNQTEDLVQITFLRALKNLESFDNRRDGAFLAFLRTVFLNLVRDEIRCRARKPTHGALDEHMRDLTPSPLEQAIGREMLERYEQELYRLEPEVREAVIMKMEMGFSYPEIASAQGVQKPNTVRMRVERALAKMAEKLDES